MKKRLVRMSRQALRGDRARVVLLLSQVALPVAVVALWGERHVVVAAAVALSLAAEGLLRAADPDSRRLVGVLAHSTGGFALIRLLLVGVVAWTVPGGSRWAFLALALLACAVAAAAVLNDYLWAPIVESARDTTAISALRVRVLANIDLGRTQPTVLEANRGRLERSVRNIFADAAEGLSGRFLQVRTVIDVLVVLAALWIALVGDGARPWVPTGVGIAGLVLVGVHAAWSVRSRSIAGALLQRSRDRVDEYEDRYLDEVRRTLERLQPDVVVYLDAYEPTYYTLYQWSDVFEQLDQTVLVVTARVLRPLPKPIALPVIHIRDQDTAVDLLPSSVKAAFYITDAVYNVMFMRKSTAAHGIKHVFVNHGDSDKAVNSQVTMRLYDQVWVAGQMAVDRFARNGVWIAPEVFRLVGRPQASAALTRSASARADDVRTVLYAPTWESFTAPENYSSLLAIGRELTEHVLARPDLRMVYRPHPATGSVDAQYREINDWIRMKMGRANRYAPADPIYELFEEADVLITDVSSVANDFLLTGKPYGMWIRPDLARTDLETTIPTASGAYIVDADSLECAIDAALGDDPVAPARAQVRAYSLYEPQEGGQARFQQLVDEVCDEVADTRRTGRPA